MTALWEPDHSPGVHACAGPVCRLCAHHAAAAAITAVNDGAIPEFLKTATGWIRSRPPGYRFTTDEMWAHLDDVGAWTPEPRAIGAVIRNASRAHLIRQTGQYVPSARPECHARPIPVWERI